MQSCSKLELLFPKWESKTRGKMGMQIGNILKIFNSNVCYKPRNLMPIPHIRIVPPAIA